MRRSLGVFPRTLIDGMPPTLGSTLELRHDTTDTTDTTTERDMSDASDSLLQLSLLEREIAEAEAAIAQEEARVHAQLSALPPDPAAERARQILLRLKAIEDGASFDVTHLKAAAVAQVRAVEGTALSERQAAVEARRTALEARRRALQANSEFAAGLATTRATRLAEVESLDTTVTLLESALARAADRARKERDEAARKEAARVEAQRQEGQKLEAQRNEAQRLEAERLEAARIENERKAERARVESERLAETVSEASQFESETVVAAPIETTPTIEFTPVDAQSDEVPTTQTSTIQSPTIQSPTIQSSTIQSPTAEAQTADSKVADSPPAPVARSTGPTSKPPMRKASRRKRVRLAPPPTRLEVEVATFGETNFFTGFERSLASGGIFVETFHNLPVGHELELELTLQGRKIQSRARVEFVRETSLANSESTPGAGLALLDLAEDDRAAIEAFFEKREPLFFVSPGRTAA